MVFVLKYRKNLISAEIFDAIKEILLGISERYYLMFQAVGHTQDHLHILVEAAPRYSPSDVMQICKSITAKQLFKKFPALRNSFTNIQYFKTQSLFRWLGSPLLHTSAE